MNNTKENENNQQKQVKNQNNNTKTQQTENKINSQPQRKTQPQQTKPQTAQTVNQQINQNQQRQNEEEEVTTMPEKKTIVYLVILTLILIFIALFFICDIVDRGKINSSETASITYPDNDVIVIDDGGNNGNAGNNGSTGDKDNSTKVVDADASLKIFEGTKQWSELKELNIFDRNHNHVVNGKIAPGVEETYIYTVECYGDYNMLYDMQFFDENPLNINMKFKLRRNGKFVAGDENTWVTVDQLKQAGMKIAPKTIDVFILDWRWEDADNDTEIGETEGAQYKLNIKSNAEAIIEN